MERFAAANRYVFAVPMCDAGILYRQTYIDVIHQPAITFEINEKKYSGLRENQHATLTLSAGALSVQPAVT